MTKYHDVDITCPYCGRTGPFRIYDSINTVLDPELKEALFDFSLFTFTCPVCQKKAPVLYPLLYHQMEDRLMIYLIDRDKADEAKEIFSQLPFTIGKYAPGKEYTCRIVTDPDSLLEKIRIHDARLDDRIIEILKLFVREKTGDEKIPRTDSIRYIPDHEGNPGGLLLFKEQKATGSTVISEEAYTAVSHLLQAGESLPAAKEMVIDQAWAETFLEQTEKLLNAERTPDSRK